MTLSRTNSICKQHSIVKGIREYFDTNLKLHTNYDNNTNNKLRRLKLPIESDHLLVVQIFGTRVTVPWQPPDEFCRTLGIRNICGETAWEFQNEHLQFGKPFGTLEKFLNTLSTLNNCLTYRGNMGKALRLLVVLGPSQSDIVCRGVPRRQ